MQSNTLRGRTVHGRSLLGLLAASLALGLMPPLAAPVRAEDGALGFLRGKSEEEKARERAVEEIRKKARIVEKGTSDGDERRMATRELPLDRLSPRNRQRVDAVLDNLSTFRKLPTIAVEVDPHLYQFFVVNPDVAVSIWRAMKISEFQMTQTGPARYDAAVGDGTEGDIEVLYRTPKEHLVMCDGVYKGGPLMKTISARCLLHLRTEFLRDRDGVTSVRHRLNMFVSFPSNTVEFGAKVVSPVSNMIVDRNFREVSLFLHMMTVLSTRRPQAVENIAGRLDVTEPKREAFRRVSADVYARSQQGSAVTQPPKPISSVDPDPGIRPVARLAEAGN